MEQYQQFEELLTDVLACIDDEIALIQSGGASKWRLDLLQNIVRPEMESLWAQCRNGHDFHMRKFKPGMLKSMYFMSDSIEPVFPTPLGKKLCHVSELHECLYFRGDKVTRIDYQSGRLEMCLHVVNSAAPENTYRITLCGILAGTNTCGLLNQTDLIIEYVTSRACTEVFHLNKSYSPDDDTEFFWTEDEPWPGMEYQEISFRFASGQTLTAICMYKALHAE